MSQVSADVPGGVVRRLAGWLPVAWAMGLFAAAPETSAAGSVSTDLRTLNNIAVCQGALSSALTDWETSSRWQAHRQEAERRGLGVEQCRKVLGASPAPRVVTDLKVLEAPVPRVVSDYEVCQGALNAARTSWNPGETVWRAQAADRRLRIDDCRTALGYRPMAPLFRATDVIVCRGALNSNRTQFETADAWKDYRAEAEDRGLTVETCRTRLGIADSVRVAQVEQETCEKALNADRSGWANAHEALAWRKTAEQAGLDVRACRARLNVPDEPTVAMVAAVEDKLQLTLYRLPVAASRCLGLVARLNFTIAKARPLQETITVDEQRVYPHHLDARVEVAAQLLAAAFQLRAPAQLPVKPVTGRVRGAICIDENDQQFSLFDARRVDREELGARIERLSASDVRFTGRMGVWQFPELAAELAASEAPRRLIIDSAGGQVYAAFLMKELVDLTDTRIVVGRGA